jgi:hypothetical protein
VTGCRVDELIDSEWRPLRPIGISTGEVAARTGRLLARLTRRPGVHLFSGVAVTDGLAVTHALSAGRLVLFVESVAWPDGTYSTGPDGGVRCGGVYIGQTVRPLLEAVRRLRRTLPDDFRIGGVVVVHPSTPAAPTLPATVPAGLSWLTPGGLTSHVRRRVRRALYCQTDTKPVTLRWSPDTLGH